MSDPLRDEWVFCFWLRIMLYLFDTVEI